MASKRKKTFDNGNYGFSNKADKRLCDKNHRKINKQNGRLHDKRLKEIFLMNSIPGSNYMQ